MNQDPTPQPGDKCPECGYALSKEERWAVSACNSCNSVFGRKRIESKPWGKEEDSLLQSIETWISKGQTREEIEELVRSCNLEKFYKTFGYAPLAWKKGKAILKAELQVRKLKEEGMRYERSGTTLKKIVDVDELVRDSKEGFGDHHSYLLHADLQMPSRDDVPIVGARTSDCSANIRSKPKRSKRNARLKIAMVKADMTGRELSRRSGVHEITVSTALNGRVETSPETAKKFAKVLKTTPQKLGLVFEGRFGDRNKCNGQQPNPQPNPNPSPNPSPNRGPNPRGE